MIYKPITTDSNNYKVIPDTAVAELQTTNLTLTLEYPPRVQTFWGPGLQIYQVMDRYASRSAGSAKRASGQPQHDPKQSCDAGPVYTLLSRYGSM